MSSIGTMSDLPLPPVWISTWKAGLLQPKTSLWTSPIHLSLFFSIHARIIYIIFPSLSLSLFLSIPFRVRSIQVRGRGGGDPRQNSVFEWKNNHSSFVILLCLLPSCMYCKYPRISSFSPHDTQTQLTGSSFLFLHSSVRCCFFVLTRLAMFTHDRRPWVAWTVTTTAAPLTGAQLVAALSYSLTNVGSSLSSSKHVVWKTSLESISRTPCGWFLNCSIYHV